MSGVSRTVALVMAAGLIGGSLWSAPLAHAAPPTPVLGASPDFNADGLPDVVYGSASDNTFVTVHYGGGTDQVIHRTDVGGPADNEFGIAVLARDLNGDSYCDLVIADRNGAGAIVVIVGGPGGLDIATAKTYDAPANGKIFTFGSSLALLTTPTPLLVVGGEQTGVPGGSFAAYPLGPDGLVSGASFWINQSSPGVPGTAETGDQFGAAMAASGATLVVGVPGEDIGKKRDAGNIVVLTYRGGTAFTGVAIGQNSAKVPGTAQKGDRFGASVSMTAGLVAVGVPGESHNAGLVQLFTRKGSKLKASVAISQNSSGVPGVSRADDGFGTSVALATVCANGAKGIVVGAPGETHLARSEAGTAWVIPVKRTKTCTAKMFSEKDIPGVSVNYYDHFGDAVAVVKSPSSVANTILVGSSGDQDFGVSELVSLASPYKPASATTIFQDIGLNDDVYALSSLAS